MKGWEFGRSLPSFDKVISLFLESFGDSSQQEACVHGWVGIPGASPYVVIGSPPSWLLNTALLLRRSTSERDYGRGLCELPALSQFHENSILCISECIANFCRLCFFISHRVCPVCIRVIPCSQLRQTFFRNCDRPCLQFHQTLFVITYIVNGSRN